MKFTDLMVKENYEGGNTEACERMVDLIHTAVKQELIYWDGMFSSEEFIQILGVTKTELESFITKHDFHDDHITLVFSGNRSEFVHLGKNPKKYTDPNYTETPEGVEKSDPAATEAPTEAKEETKEEITEAAKVSSLKGRELDDLFKKWVDATGIQGPLGKLFKRFKRMDMLAVGKDIKAKKIVSKNESEEQSEDSLIVEKVVKVTDLDFTEPNDPGLKKALKKYKVKLTNVKEGPSGYDTGTISGQEKDVIKFLMARDGYGLDREEAEDFIKQG